MFVCLFVCLFVVVQITYILKHVFCYVTLIIIFYLVIRFVLEHSFLHSNHPVAMVESSDRVSQYGAFRTDSTLVNDLSASLELPKARVILVGDSGTGKTSLVKQLATGVFDPMCSPTIG